MTKVDQSLDGLGTMKSYLRIEERVLVLLSKDEIGRTQVRSAEYGSVERTSIIPK